MLDEEKTLGQACLEDLGLMRRAILVIRDLKGLTMFIIAQQAGVDRMTIRRVAEGRVKNRTDSLARIARWIDRTLGSVE